MIFKYPFRVMIGSIVFTVITFIYGLISGNMADFVFLFNFNVLFIGGAIILYLRQFDPDINKKETLTTETEIVSITQIVLFGMFFSVILFFLNYVGMVLFAMISGYGAYRFYTLPEEDLEHHDRLIRANLIEVFLGSMVVPIAVVVIYLSPVGIIIENLGYLTTFLVLFVSFTLPGIYIRSILQFREWVLKFQEADSQSAKTT